MPCRVYKDKLLESTCWIYVLQSLQGQAVGIYMLNICLTEFTRTSCWNPHVEYMSYRVYKDKLWNPHVEYMSYRVYKDKLLESTCWIYVLQSLQGQAVGIHMLNKCLQSLQRQAVGTHMLNICLTEFTRTSCWNPHVEYMSYRVYKDKLLESTCWIYVLQSLQGQAVGIHMLNICLTEFTRTSCWNPHVEYMSYRVYKDKLLESTCWIYVLQSLQGQAVGIHMLNICLTEFTRTSCWNPHVEYMSYRVYKDKLLESTCWIYVLQSLQGQAVGMLNICLTEFTRTSCWNPHVEYMSYRVYKDKLLESTCWIYVLQSLQGQAVGIHMLNICLTEFTRTSCWNPHVEYMSYRVYKDKLLESTCWIYVLQSLQGQAVGIRMLNICLTEFTRQAVGIHMLNICLTVYKDKLLESTCWIYVLQSLQGQAVGIHMLNICLTEFTGQAVGIHMLNICLTEFTRTSCWNPHVEYMSYRVYKDKLLESTCWIYVLQSLQGQAVGIHMLNICLTEFTRTSCWNPHVEYMSYRVYRTSCWNPHVEYMSYRVYKDKLLESTCWIYVLESLQGQAVGIHMLNICLTEFTRTSCWNPHVEYMSYRVYKDKLLESTCWIYVLQSLQGQAVGIHMLNICLTEFTRTSCWNPHVEYMSEFTRTSCWNPHVEYMSYRVYKDKLLESTCWIYVLQSLQGQAVGIHMLNICLTEFTRTSCWNPHVEYMSYIVYEDKLLESTCWIYVLQSLHGQAVGIHMLNICLTEFTKDKLLESTCWIYVLQSLQGQAVGIHMLNICLTEFTRTSCWNPHVEYMSYRVYKDKLLESTCWIYVLQSLQGQAVGIHMLNICLTEFTRTSCWNPHVEYMSCWIYVLQSLQGQAVGIHMLNICLTEFTRTSCWNPHVEYMSYRVYKDKLLESTCWIYVLQVYKDKLLESTCWIYVLQSLQGQAVGIHMLNICLTEFTRTSCWNPHVEYMSYRVYKDKLLESTCWIYVLQSLQDKLLESTCWIYVLQSLQGQAVGIHMLNICLTEFTRTSCWNPHVEYMSYRVYKDKLLESTCWIYVLQSLQGQAVGIHMLNICLTEFTRTSCWNPHVEYMSYRVYKDKLLESTCWIYVLQSLQGQAVGIHMLNICLTEFTRTSCWNPHVEYMSYRVYKDKLLESTCWIYVLQSLQGQAVGIHMLNICLTEFTRTSCWNPHVEYMSYRVYKDKLLESTCWIYVLQSLQGQAVGIHMLNICLTEFTRTSCWNPHVEYMSYRVYKYMTSCWNPHVEYMSYRVYKDKLLESTCWIYVLQSLQGQAVGIHMLNICLTEFTRTSCGIHMLNICPTEFTRTSCWNPHVEYMSYRVYKDKLLESTCWIYVLQSLQGQAVGIHMLNICLTEFTRTSCWNPHVEYMSYRVYKDKLLESTCWIYVLQSLQGQAVGIHMLNICLTEFTRTSCWNPHVEYMSYRVYKDKLLESTCWICLTEFTYVLQSLQGQAVGIHMLNICLTEFTRTSCWNPHVICLNTRTSLTTCWIYVLQSLQGQAVGIHMLNICLTEFTRTSCWNPHVEYMSYRVYKDKLLESTCWIYVLQSLQGQAVGQCWIYVLQSLQGQAVGIHMLNICLAEFTRTSCWNPHVEYMSYRVYKDKLWESTCWIYVLQSLQGQAVGIYMLNICLTEFTRTSCWNPHVEYMSYRVYKDKLLESTCWIYVLQSLQGQAVGIHMLNKCLTEFTTTSCWNPHVEYMSYIVYEDKLLESTCWIYVLQSLHGQAVGIYMLNICLTEFTRTSCWNPHVEYMSYRVYKDKLLESACWIYVLQSLEGQAVGIRMLNICLTEFTRTSCWNPHVEYMSYRVYKDKLLESTCWIYVLQSLQGQAVGIHMLNICLTEFTRTSCWNPHVEYMSYRVYKDKLLESTCWIYVLQSLQGQAVGIHMLNICLTEFTRTSCWNPHVEYMSYRVYKDKLLESTCWIYVLQSLQGQAVGIHMLNICLTEFTEFGIHMDLQSCWNPHVEYMSYRVYKDKLLESTCWIYVFGRV